MSCNYAKLYVNNLTYVSSELLDIINEKILVQSYSSFNSVKDENGFCSVLIQPPETFNPFSCSDWDTIKTLLLTDSGEGAPGYLTMLCETLDCILTRVGCLDYGLKSQFERFKCLCNSLKAKLLCICCHDSCKDILGDFLCLLLQIFTQLISAISKAASIVLYCECAKTECKVVAESFFNCIVCDFVNDLCELDKLVNELSSIVVAFSICDSPICTPCYTATCAPRKVRPVCPPNLVHGGPKPPYGQMGTHHGGCGCKTCK